MDVLAPLFFCCVFLLMAFTPVWFIFGLVRFCYSQAQRDKVKAHWFLYSVLGVISLLILSVAWLTFAPRHFYYGTVEPFESVPIASESIAQADAIVEGTFDTRHLVSTSGQILTFRYGPGVKANCFVVPFNVDASAKGNLGKTIHVKICFPAARVSMEHWGLPLQEKMLLLLKKDPTQAGVFEIMSQQTSWLVIVHPHASDATSSDPSQFVLDDAKEFHQECADHPGTSAAIKYYTDMGNIFTTVVGSFPQSDPARQHALQWGQILAKDDPDFAALASRFEGEYGEVGELAAGICANSGDTTYLEAQLKEYNKQPVGIDAPSGNFGIIGNNHSNFPSKVVSAIRDSDHVGKLLPVISLALASPDPRMRLEVARALSQRQMANNENYQLGNQLGNQFYPVVVKLLDDPDREVQYAAMSCLFWMSGSIKQPFGHRDLDLWATKIVEQNPDPYIAQFKEWWAQHKSALSP